MSDTNDKISKAANALEALPPKDKSPKGVMALVDALYDQITAAIEKGYTYEEISKLLEQSDVKIKPSTLRQYYVEKKRKVTGEKPKRRTGAKRKASEPTPAGA